MAFLCILIYPKPVSIYLRGTIGVENLKVNLLTADIRTWPSIGEKGSSQAGA